MAVVEIASQRSKITPSSESWPKGTKAETRASGAVIEEKGGELASGEERTGRI